MTVVRGPGVGLLLVVGGCPGGDRHTVVLRASPTHCTPVSCNSATCSRRVCKRGRGDHQLGEAGAACGWRSRDVGGCPGRPGRGRGGSRRRAQRTSHLRVAQLKIEQHDVLPDPRRGGRLRDDHVAQLQVPAEHDLGGGPAVPAGQLHDDRVASAWPSPRGLHASVMMPCAVWKCRSASCWSWRCSSIWFSAGTTCVSSSSRRRWATWKLDTPMARTRPSAPCLHTQPTQEAPKTREPVSW